MDSELVSQTLSDTGGREAQSPSVPFSHGKFFEEQLPYYLAIGMTPDEYWNGDNTLPAAYRAAERQRQDRVNTELWLQGMYIYDALCCASPLFKDWAKKGTKAHPYPKQPYEIHPKSPEKKVSSEKQKYEKNLAIMAAWAKNVNRKFAEKEVTNLANDDRLPASRDKGLGAKRSKRSATAQANADGSQNRVQGRHRPQDSRKPGKGGR